MDNVRLILQDDAENWRKGLKYGKSIIYYFRGASLARPDLSERIIQLEFVYCDRTAARCCGSYFVFIHYYRKITDFGEIQVDISFVEAPVVSIHVAGIFLRGMR